MANNVGHINKCLGYVKILCKRKNSLVIDLQNYKVVVRNLDLLSFVIGTNDKQFIYLGGDLANLGRGFPKRSLVDVTRPFLAKLSHQKQRENVFFGCTQQSACTKILHLPGSHLTR